MKRRTIHGINPGTVLLLASLILLFAPPLIPDSVVAALTATPLRRAVSTGLATLLFLIVCFWSVPRIFICSADATGGDH